MRARVADVLLTNQIQTTFISHLYLPSKGAEGAKVKKVFEVVYYVRSFV